MIRAIDRDEVWKLFVRHYWDSFQKDRDLILCHIDAVLRMTPSIDSLEELRDPVEFTCTCGKRFEVKSKQHIIGR